MSGLIKFKAHSKFQSLTLQTNLCLRHFLGQNSKSKLSESQKHLLSSHGEVRILSLFEFWTMWLLSSSPFIYSSFYLSLFFLILSILIPLNIRAGHRSWETIVLSQERTELSRTIPSFRKKNEHIERVLKNIGTIIKRTNVERTEIAWKER